MPTTEQVEPTEGSTDELRRLARRGRFVTLVVLGLLVVLVAVTAAAGGFARRTDEVRPADPGEVLTTGQFVLTFTTGTVQHHASDDTWDVEVLGTGRTTDETSQDIPQGETSSTFVFAQDVGTRQVVPVGGWSYGPTSEASSHDHLVPGMGPVDLRASFEFPTQPQGKLRLVVLDQKYTTLYVLSDEQGWERQRTGHDLAIPLTVLPETTY